ncbi:hypothetical protein BH09PSE6_BH09PSE6_15660 [soil metagenome]
MTEGTTLSDLDPKLLAAIEHTAVELAQLGGAEIVHALGSMLSVKYKSLDEIDPELLRDPVSEIDGRVESMIRLRLAERFPGHDIIGEEMDERPGIGHDFTWAVDPIDGTTNFINGFPMFASSVGVLFRGRPVVGALWCSSTHTLRAGVYHAGAGQGLRFDGMPVERTANPAVRRRLAGEPHAVNAVDVPWDTRKTGSASLECAFVAIGLLRVARFESPNLWDVAGGVALAKAAGASVLERRDGQWRDLEAFDADPDLSAWRRPMILGDATAVDLMAKRNA